MKLHANAALSLNQRRRLARRIVEEGWSLTEAAEAAEVSERTAAKWARRYRSEGEAGLLDRSCAARRLHNRTSERRVGLICALRRLRLTGAEIAEALADARDDRLRDPDANRSRPPRPPRPRASATLRALPARRAPARRRQETGADRGQRRAPNGRPAAPQPRRTDGSGVARARVGWECVHVCVDDATRLAYVEVLGDERATTAVGFLRRALAFYRRHGIAVERVMTDNGSAYVSRVHAIACRAMGIRHLRTRPYRPQTNGKAERFIRTMLGGWAYGAVYRDSAERTSALEGWLWRYNFRRPHGSLGRRPPAARLAELNNALGSYS